MWCFTWDSSRFFMYEHIKLLGRSLINFLIFQVVNLQKSWHTKKKVNQKKKNWQQKNDWRPHTHDVYRASIHLCVMIIQYYISARWANFFVLFIKSTVMNLVGFILNDKVILKFSVWISAFHLVLSSEQKKTLWTNGRKCLNRFSNELNKKKTNFSFAVFRLCAGKREFFYPFMDTLKTEENFALCRVAWLII